MSKPDWQMMNEGPKGGGGEGSMSGWGMAAQAGGQVLQQYMADIAERKRQERQAKIDAEQKAGEMQMQAHGQQGQAQGNALSQLMQAYRSSLMG